MESKNSIKVSGTLYRGITPLSLQHPSCKISANPCAHPREGGSRCFQPEI